MADLHDYFFRQRVTELELDEGFEFLEQADRDLALDWDFVGAAQGMTVTEQAVPNLTVDVSSGVAYSKAGERIDVDSTPILDLSVDENAISTEPGTPGNSLVISIFVEFSRALTDPRIDGNAATVFFNRFESFNFVVRKGPEAATPGGGAEEAFIAANGSPLDSGLILIADVLRANGQTQLFDADIYTTRRENTFKLTAGSLSLDAGTAKDAVQAMLQQLNDHILDVAGAHDASAVAFSNTGINAGWANTKAATQVQAAIDGIENDLIATTGANRIGFVKNQNWADGTFINIFTVGEALNEIVADLANAGAGDDGADRIGYDPTGATWADASAVTNNQVGNAITEIVTDLGGSGGAGRIGYDAGATNLSSTNVEDALDELDAEKGGLATNNTWTGQQAFQGYTRVHDADFRVEGDTDGSNLVQHFRELNNHLGGAGTSTSDTGLLQECTYYFDTSATGASGFSIMPIANSRCYVFEITAFVVDRNTSTLTGKVFDGLFIVQVTAAGGTSTQTITRDNTDINASGFTFIPLVSGGNFGASVSQAGTEPLGVLMHVRASSIANALI